MRVVLDTNIIISATLIRGGNEDQILRAWQRGVFELVLSPQILEAIGRALSYEKPRKSRWMTQEEMVELLQTLAQGSLMVSGHVKVRASRDPEDDKFLAAAIQAEADFVVTGDRDLLVLEHYRGVRVLRPAPFLQIIRRRLRL